MPLNVNAESKEYLLGFINGAASIIVEMIIEKRLDQERFKSLHFALFPLIYKLGLSEEDLATTYKEYCESVGHSSTTFFNLIQI